MIGNWYRIYNCYFLHAFGSTDKAENKFICVGISMFDQPLDMQLATNFNIKSIV